MGLPLLSGGQFYSNSAEAANGSCPTISFVKGSDNIFRTPYVYVDADTGQCKSQVTHTPLPYQNGVSLQGYSQNGVFWLLPGKTESGINDRFGTSQTLLGACVGDGCGNAGRSDYVLCDPAAGACSVSHSYTDAAGRDVTFSFVMPAASATPTDEYEIRNFSTTYSAPKNNQVISFGPISNRKYGTADPVVGGWRVKAAIASSNPDAPTVKPAPPFLRSLTPSVCTAGRAFVNHPLEPYYYFINHEGIGTCTIEAYHDGNSGWNAATSVQQSFVISQNDQVILFNDATITPQSFVIDKVHRFSSVATTNGATSWAQRDVSSKLMVSYSSLTPNVCTVSGSTLTAYFANPAYYHFSNASITMVAPGDCTLQATQAGDANFTAAPTIQKTIKLVPPALNLTIAVPSKTVNGGTSITAFTPVTATGGYGALSYGISPALPTGLSMAGSSGQISGNAQAAAVGRVYAVTVTDSTLGTPQSKSANFTFQVGAACTATLKPNAISDLTYSPNTQPINVATQLENCIAENKGPIGTSITYSSPEVSSSQQSVASVANTFYGAGLQLKAGTAVGNYSVVATFSADAGGLYTASNSPVHIPFKVGKADQAINFTDPADQIFVLNAAVPLVATGGASSIPVTFTTQTSTVCSISESQATMLTAGNCTIRASQVGNDNYNAAPVADQTFAIGKGAQTISFTKPADQAFTPNGAVQLTATGGASGNRLTFASQTSTVCSVSESQATMLTAGNCTIRASQAGNDNYNVAADADQTFAIGKAAQTLSFTKPADQAFTPSGAVQLTATGGASGIPVTFTTQTSTVCSVSESQATMLTAGNCTIRASQAGNDNYNVAPDADQIFAIGKAAQTLSFTKPADQAFTPKGAVQLTATGGASGIPVTFTSQTSTVCTVLESQAILLTAGNCTIRASQAGNDNYNVAADADQTFAIGKAAQTISFTKPANQAFTPNGAVQLTATGGASGIPVTFTSQTSTVCTVLESQTILLTAGNCTIRASQAGNDNYNVAPDADQTFAIGKAAQTIGFSANPTSIQITYASALTVTGGAGTGQVSYALKDGAAFCSLSGSEVTGLATGQCTVEATKAGDISHNPAKKTLSIQVAKLTATVDLSGSSTQAELGEPVTYTATVSTNRKPALRVLRTSLPLSPPQVQGTVTFSDNGNPICAKVPLVNKAAQCTARFTTPGAHNVTAQFHGNASSATNMSRQLATAIDNSVEKTTQVQVEFMEERANLLVSSQFGGGRQVARLRAATTDQPTQTTSLANSSGSNSYLLSSSRLSSVAPQLSDAFFKHNPSQNVSAKPQGGLADLSISLLSSFMRQGPDNLSFSSNLSGVEVSGRISDRIEMAFSTSLSALNKASEAGNALEFDDRTPSTNQSFDMWAEGSFSTLRTSGNNDGHFGILTLGADYVLNPSVLVGAYMQFDSMNQSSDTASSSVRGQGWMAGPYATIRLTENLFFQSRAAWGQSKNKITPTGSYTDMFDTTRWLASMSLTGNYEQGNWLITPTASLSYFEETAESYRNTFGVFIPEVETSLGQFKAGPAISYRFQLSAKTVLEPHFGGQVIWNFANRTSATGVPSSKSDGTNNLRARAELGLKISMPNGIGADLQGSYDGIGSDDFEAISGRMRVNIPLN
ncbi:autotransporter domain-containing protein [Pseudovibrio sp. Tun.PSC04-5.I4]|uniref:autotransporter outer membrane beta-barrel domain-containing protein n=1 Tax=Pseudovibrio sp. Tun.PSC04-5.I4 TaxID=1798213 RepID=UPI0013565967|nr:autotransporter domain-containing protein [Pseudovibrio sp. Tun.PSC04-5.I4]